MKTKILDFEGKEGEKEFKNLVELLGFKYL
jgi:hypothetical protein